VTRGSRPPPRFGSEYGEAAAPRRLAGGGQEAGENGERDEGVRMPYLSRAGMERGGLAMKADGGGRRWPWRRRCKARGGASGGGGVCGGGERDGRPIYRRSKAVGERYGRLVSSRSIFNGGGSSGGAVLRGRRGEQGRRWRVAGRAVAGKVLGAGEVDARRPCGLCSQCARAPRRRRCAVRRGEARGPRARAWTCRGAARAYGRR